MGVQNWNRKRIGISHKLLSLLASYFEDSKHKTQHTFKKL